MEYIITLFIQFKRASHNQPKSNIFTVVAFLPGVEVKLIKYRVIANINKLIFSEHSVEYSYKELYTVVNSQA